MGRINKVFAVLFLSHLALYGVDFKTYDEALAEQKVTNKIIMLDIIRTDCQYCETMQLNVFDDKNMSKYIDDKFISVKLDLDKDEIPLGIKVMFTPSFYFINNDKHIIKKIAGSWNIEDFKDLTRNIK